jgi:hypothetical protein
MKRIPLAAALVAAACCAWGQDSKPFGAGLGFSVGGRGGDLSLGLEATSPFLLGGRAALRAAGEVLLMEGVLKGESAAAVEDYYIGRLGIAVGSNRSALTRLYGEFDGLVLLATEHLAGSAAPRYGISGVFGFELGLGEAVPGCYFVEMGSTSTFGASADRLLGEPLIAQGFSARAGFRWRF